MPEKIANATTTRWVLTIGFSGNWEMNGFLRENRLSASRRPFPMPASAARDKTLCAIDQAHCEVQKAQSRVTHPAAGDLRRADKRRLLREKGWSAAVCVGQRASRSVPQANRSA
jgi:hypothetical protein